MPTDAETRAVSPRRKRAGWTMLALAVVTVAVVTHGANREAADARRGVELVDGPQRAADSTTLKIASFNIHHGVGRDGRYDLKRVADTIEGFDIVALNEVAQSFVANQAELLAKQLEMGWLYAPSERRWWHDHWGNAVLSKFDVARWQSTPLDCTRGKGFRCYVEVEIPWRDRTLHLLAVHIDRQHDREAQLHAVIERFLALPEPAVLLGDLNTRDDPKLKELLEHPSVIDPIARSSEDRPHIDWILARGLVPIAGGFRDIGASDHPCIWAELELPEATALAGGDDPAHQAENLE